MTSKWNQFALGEIIELVIDYRGKTPKKLGGDWCNQGYRALSAKNIKTGRIVQAETIRYIDESLYRKWMKNEVQHGDILITSEAPFGQIFFWDSDEKIVLSQRLFCVRIKPEYDARFIYYYMTTPEFQNELDGRATGTTVIGLRQPELMKCVIQCPEIQEQKVIAAILSSIDEKIIANEKVNDNLEQQAQTIYYERFETVSPNDLPSNWRIVTLGEVAAISNKSFNPLKEPEILLEHYSIPAFDEAKFPVFELSTSIKSNKFIIDASCFMISKLNPTTKRVWKPYCLTGNAVCSTEFIVYKAKDKSITNFLYSVIDSSSFSNFMCSHVTGSSGSIELTSKFAFLFGKLGETVFVCTTENVLAIPMLDHLNVGEEINHFAKTPLVQLRTGKVLRQNIFEPLVFFLNTAHCIINHRANFRRVSGRSNRTPSCILRDKEDIFGSVFVLVFFKSIAFFNQFLVFCLEAIRNVFQENQSENDRLIFGCVDVPA